MEIDKPSISIITPCNRIIPWFNAHLINVCSSDYDNWEWIILDNSPDGCVVRYVDDFFENTQGKYFYPECRERVKCMHDPMTNVRFEDGRLGVLRNRCVEMCNCGDDGFILTLDSDDFIYQDFLSIIHDISLKYPSCEVISGMCNQSLCQFLENGAFTHQTGMREWNDNNYWNEITMLRNTGFDGVGFEEYAHSCIDGGLRPFIVKEFHSRLDIPNVGIYFIFDNATVLNENGYPFITGFGHPIVYKKKAFLEKIGGYVEMCSVEDSVTKLMPFLLDDVVYVNKPVYVQICMLNASDCSRNSAVVDANAVYNDEIGCRITVEQLLKVYDKLGDCRKFVKPIIYNC